MKKTDPSSSIEYLIGRRIWRLRKARKYSQEVLAEKSQINPSFLGCIERGQKCPTLRVLERIRQALDVTYTELFDFSEDQKRGNLDSMKEKFTILIQKLEGDDLALLDGVLEAFFQQKLNLQKKDSLSQPSDLENESF